MLIAIHGAVLTLLVFMRPNSFVAELFFRPYPDPNGMFEVCSPLRAFLCVIWRQAGLFLAARPLGRSPTPRPVCDEIE